MKGNNSNGTYAESVTFQLGDQGNGQSSVGSQGVHNNSNLSFPGDNSSSHVSTRSRRAGENAGWADRAYGGLSSAQHNAARIANERKSYTPSYSSKTDYSKISNHVQPVMPPSPSKPVSPSKPPASPTKVETCSKSFWGGLWTSAAADAATPSDDALSDATRQLVSNTVQDRIEKDCKDVRPSEVSSCRIS